MAKSPKPKKPPKPPQPVWALDPKTGRRMTEEYVASYGYRARQAKEQGFMAQLGFGLSEAFSGGPVGGMQKQLALMQLGGVGQTVGSLAGASSAFGPAGLALAGGQMVLDAARKGIHELGDISAKVAGNDYLGLFTTRMGLAGEAIGEFARVVNAFIQRAKDLEPYSGMLAGNLAVADVRSTLSDMREAQELEGTLSKLVDAASRFEVEFREVMLPIKKIILENVTEFLMGCTVILETLKLNGAQALATLGAMLKVLVDFATGNWLELMRDVVDVRDHLAQIRRNTDRPDPIDSLMNNALAGLRAGLEGAFAHVPGDPMAVAAAQRLNAPVLGNP